MKTVQPLQNARQNPFSNPPPKNPLLKVAGKRKNSVSSHQSFIPFWSLVRNIQDVHFYEAIG
jgi:hypothetical protein